MHLPKPESAGRAWYSADRQRFLAADQSSVVAELSSAATSQGWHIESQQHEEWGASVDILQSGMDRPADVEVEILRTALNESGLAE